MKRVSIIMGKNFMKNKHIKQVKTLEYGSTNLARSGIYIDLGATTRPPCDAFELTDNEGK